ncbi:hypothetical protein [Priestia megaterium]|uniref:hypothetical protein n=1 Tax=Priestia megaterium TaxID=1404 RepID=UPI002E1C14B5|nr:hypothetical protein [Priestia megaterium]
MRKQLHCWLDSNLHERLNVIYKELNITKVDAVEMAVHAFVRKHETRLKKKHEGSHS